MLGKTITLKHHILITNDRLCDRMCKYLLRAHEENDKFYLDTCSLFKSGLKYTSENFGSFLRCQECKDSCKKKKNQLTKGGSGA